MSFCHNKKYEREFVRFAAEKGFTCFRIAGSGSAKEAVCDCVLYLPEPCLVEVKATKEEILYMRKGIREQLQLMVDACKKNNLIPLLAVKFKNRGWNILKIDSFENVRFDKKRMVDENIRESVVGD